MLAREARRRPCAGSRILAFSRGANSLGSHRSAQEPHARPDRADPAGASSPGRRPPPALRQGSAREEPEEGLREAARIGQARRSPRDGFRGRPLQLRPGRRGTLVQESDGVVRAQRRFGLRPRGQQPRLPLRNVRRQKAPRPRESRNHPQADVRQQPEHDRGAGYVRFPTRRARYVHDRRLRDAGGDLAPGADRVEPRADRREQEGARAVQEEKEAAFRVRREAGDGSAAGVAPARLDTNCYS